MACPKAQRQSLARLHHPRPQPLPARGLELAPADIVSSPHCLVGSPEEIVDRLLELRETLGFSYISVYDTVFEDFAPVVAALAGL